MAGKKQKIKTTVICFRVDEDFHKALERAAEKAGRRQSELIETILLDHLRARGAMPVKEERRLHLRRYVSLPAFVAMDGSETLYPGTVRDISAGGLKVLVSEEAGTEISGRDEGNGRLHVLFALPQEKTLLKMTCRVCRMSRRACETEVAISFADCYHDFVDHRRIQKYLS